LNSPGPQRERSGGGGEPSLAEEGRTTHGQTSAGGADRGPGREADPRRPRPRAEDGALGGSPAGGTVRDGRDAARAGRRSVGPVATRPEYPRAAADAVGGARTIRRGGAPRRARGALPRPGRDVRGGPEGPLRGSDDRPRHDPGAGAGKAQRAGVVVLSGQLRRESGHLAEAPTVRRP